MVGVTEKIYAIYLRKDIRHRASMIEIYTYNTRSEAIKGAIKMLDEQYDYDWITSKREIMDDLEESIRKSQVFVCSDIPHDPFIRISISIFEIRNGYGRFDCKELNPM